MKRVVTVGLLVLSSAFAFAQGPNQTQTQQQFQQLQHSLQQMQQQMVQIQATRDSKERQRLMSEHMESLRHGMMSMMSMVGNMPHAELGPFAQECKQGDTACQLHNMQAHQELMQKYMMMMQGLMGQMMEHMGAQMSGGMHRGGAQR